MIRPRAARVDISPSPLAGAGRAAGPRRTARGAAGFGSLVTLHAPARTPPLYLFESKSYPHPAGGRASRPRGARPFVDAHGLVVAELSGSMGVLTCARGSRTSQQAAGVGGNGDDRAAGRSCRHGGGADNHGAGARTRHERQRRGRAGNPQRRAGGAGTNAGGGARAGG